MPTQRNPALWRALESRFRRWSPSSTVAVASSVSDRRLFLGIRFSSDVAWTWELLLFSLSREPPGADFFVVSGAPVRLYACTCLTALIRPSSSARWTGTGVAV